MCKISVVATVYNKEKYIGEFLESIEKQRLQDIEVILVDDGSSDACAQILDDFARKDERYKVIHQPNRGVSDARNSALNHARGEYVYIVDSDDRLADNALETMWKEAERTDADVIYGQVICESVSEATIEKTFTKAFCTESRESIEAIQCALNNKNHIYVSSPDFSAIYCLGGAPWRGMFRRTIVSENCIRYDTDLKNLGEDVLFWQHIYEYVTRVAYIEVPIYRYRMLDDSLSHGYKENLVETYRVIFNKEEEFLYEHKKNQKHWDAYYFRVIIYIHQAMPFYFQNGNNPKGEKERFEEMKILLRTKPFSVAIKKTSLKTLVSWRGRVAIIILRLNLFRLYWLLKQKGV